MLFARFRTTGSSFAPAAPRRAAAILASVLNIALLSRAAIALGQAPIPAGWSVRELPAGPDEASYVTGVGEDLQVGGRFVLIDLESGPMGPWIEPRAGYWREPSAPLVDLNPPGAVYSSVNAVAGACLAGYFGAPHGPHAVVWPSPSAPAIDLHPEGYAFSKIFATNGRQHVGYARVSPTEPIGEVAMLWTGTSPDPVKLPTPPNINSAIATAIGANQQGGLVYFPYEGGVPGLSHAFLWHGGTGRAVDLHPTGALASEISAMTDTYQAGVVSLPSAENNAREVRFFRHAALWFGTPESLRVIGPPGSSILAASGPYQVGRSNDRAMLWASSASSAVDLHALLPGDYAISAATSIWTDGKKIVVGGNSGPRAILWTFSGPN